MLYKEFFVLTIVLLTGVIAMKSDADSFEGIKMPIDLYFKGTYEANEEKIRQAFHEKAYITGFFDGVYTEWTLDEFVGRVLGKQSQKDTGESFLKHIISIEKKDGLAFVKAQAPAFGHQFSDFILLVETKDGWKIRHKSFTNSRN